MKKPTSSTPADDPPAPHAERVPRPGPTLPPGGPAPGASNSELYPYADFARAATALKDAVQRGPFYGLLVGVSGTGKSSLLRYVSAQLDRHRVQAIYLVGQRRLGPVSLGRLLAQALHVTPRRTHPETLSLLGQLVRDLPQRLVILLDEAQRPPDDTLEEVRLLAESELDRGPLLSVVMAGPPELKERLDAPELFGLKRRISLKLELTGLRVEECRPFLEKRLDTAALARFTPEATALLFERGRGIPALIASYASTVVAHTKGGTAIGKDTIADALDAWEGI